MLRISLDETTGIKSEEGHDSDFIQIADAIKPSPRELSALIARIIRPRPSGGNMVPSVSTGRTKRISTALAQTGIS